MAIDATGLDVYPREDAAGLSAAQARKPMVVGKRRTYATNSLSDVESIWAVLEQQGIESPEQSFEFVKVWVETFAIPASEQVYLVVEENGKPLALLALHRRRLFGLRALVPFAGSHVGCHAPLVDKKHFGKMSPEDRQSLWRDMTDAAKGADLIYLPYVPDMPDGPDFAALGTSVDADLLYRSAFESWEVCDQQQRSRSRRKHDKQQGAKLAALGDVTFEEVEGGPDVHAAMDVMFRDRAARFEQQGIDDPFSLPSIRAFYRSALQGGERLSGRLQLLKLDGEIVAVRYNLVHGDKMFCLISSMSVRPELQPGSPGKQIMVHLMQHIFADGIRAFDMGAGFSDEKRHWCNVQIRLKHHYVPLNAQGQVIAALHRQMVSAKAQIKNNTALFGTLKNLRTRLKGKA